LPIPFHALVLEEVLVPLLSFKGLVEQLSSLAQGPLTIPQI
jgi:hypothetical protein